MTGNFRRCDCMVTLTNDGIIQSKVSTPLPDRDYLPFKSLAFKKKTFGFIVFINEKTITKILNLIVTEQHF